MTNHSVTLLKALADETRIDIVKELSQKKEISCQELMKKFSLSQPTLSHHFNKLVAAHILNSRRDGKLWIYSLNKTYLKSIGFDIAKFVVSDVMH